MTRFHILILFSAGLLLLGCSTPRPSTISTIGKPTATLFKGTMVLGNQTQLFSPCNSRAQFQMELSPSLYNQMIQMTHHSYDALYAEIIGYLKIPSQTGYNADYQAKLHVLRINIIKPSGPQQCQSRQGTFAIDKYGHWETDVSPTKLQFHQNNQHHQMFNISKKNITATSRTYISDRASLVMEAIPCKTISGKELYGWTSRLKKGSTTFSGCGKISNYDENALWYGRYSAQSTQLNFTTSLELNPDHTARTLYDYQDGHPPIVETGFWQPIDQHRVQVVMTLHQQQYLVVERIYTRHHHILHTNEEYVKGKKYLIAQGGLSLFKESL